ncbi:hypothetical protein CGCVW01_v005021 [Colletotrichum viniferum]|nr:hypothetical protein CGCVW01_v005021 [Colletotrichum viniferum]
MSQSNRQLASSLLAFHTALDALRQLHRLIDNAPAEELVYFTSMLALDACGDNDPDLQSGSSDSNADIDAHVADPANIHIDPSKNDHYTDAAGDLEMTDAPTQEFGTLLDLDDLFETFSPVDELDRQDQRSDVSTLRNLAAIQNFTTIQTHQIADAETLDVQEAKHTNSQNTQGNVLQGFVTSKEDSSDAAHVEHVEFAKDEEVGMVEHVEYANSGQTESDEGGGGYDGGDNDTDSQPKDPMEELRQELKDQRDDLDCYYEMTRRQPPLDHEVTAPYLYWWYLHVCNKLRHREELKGKASMATMLESERGREASSRWREASGRSRYQLLSTVSPQPDHKREARLYGTGLFHAARATLISQGRSVDCVEQVRKKGLFRGVSVVNRPVEDSWPGSLQQFSQRHSLRKSLTMEEYEKMENPEDVFPKPKQIQW